MKEPIRQIFPSVVVRVPARLHLGFLDLNGDIGRQFGSVGLAIDSLSTKLTLSLASTTKVEGPQADRASRYLTLMTDFLAPQSSHLLVVDEALPSHAGLGSGTQLALAIAASVRRLHGHPLDIVSDSLRLERGGRSGIGIGLFDRGGLVVDGGRGAQTGVPPIVSHLPFPAGWRIILVLDPSRQGRHGDSERAAFASLPVFPNWRSAQICRLILMKALPAVQEDDIISFGAAVRDVQALLGDHFAPAQGGRFASPQVAAILDLLEGAGAHGIGQSSWGPTGFAFAKTDSQAQSLAALARSHPNARGLDIRVAAGLNRGAEIMTRATGKAAGSPDSGDAPL